jgi:hypothetical protein
LLVLISELKFLENHTDEEVEEQIESDNVSELKVLENHTDVEVEE